MRKHIPLKNAYQHASIAVHQSQTIIEDEPTSTATESPMHSLWQIFNVPFLTQNSSIHKKEDDDSSVDETFWFDVISLPEITEGSILSQEEIYHQIDVYESKYGMTSQEFLRQFEQGKISDTFEMMDWIMLLNYQKTPPNHAV